MAYSEKLPSPRELKKELNDYLTKKYGNRIKLGFSPSVFPDKDEHSADDASDESTSGLSQIDFGIKPEELLAYLNEYIIKQDDAKEILATKICTHFNRIKFYERYKNLDDASQVGSIKNNIIMIGPTGVGKTYLIKLIAQKIGVPFVKGDATKFSETGYVGGDVDDLIRDLVHEAEGDIERAQFGIVYIDEIDKIASSSHLIGPDVSRTGVQRALLKPMEETEVDLKVPHDIISQMEAVEEYRRTGKREKRRVNTRHILFIVSGAFTGLEEIVQKRLQQQGLGFGAEIRSRCVDYDIMRRLKSEDLIAYGFESEFIGRLPVVAVLEPLTEEDLYHILKNVNNPVIVGKKKDFRSYGINVAFDDATLRKIAQSACREKTGARGLVSTVERALIKFERKLPSTSIRHLVVTPEMVDAPAEALEQLLRDSDTTEMEQAFRCLAEREFNAVKQSLLNRKEEFVQHYGTFFANEIIDTLVSWVVDEGISLGAAFQEATRLHQSVRTFEQDFEDIYNLSISFAEDALTDILDKSFREGIAPEIICDAAVKNYEYGLKLVQEKTGRTRFTIHRQALSDPEAYLNHLINTTATIFSRQTLWHGVV